MASTYGARHNLPGYDTFRTGLDFETVQRMLWTDSEDQRDWKHKSRGCVLRLWCSIKKSLYEEMLDRTGGRAPVKKKIVHRGRRFVVTYWVKVQSPKTSPIGRIPVRKTIINKGRSMTVTYWTNPERIAA
jgi:hypothetical protein